MTLYGESNDMNLSLSYRGPFADDLTHRIIGITENTITDHQGLPKINRKVSFLLVECFQNIIKHGESVSAKEKDLSDEGLFHFRNVGYAYIINSINLVKNEEVSELVRTVELVNSLDSASLKAMYKEQLQNNEFSEKGGAGLGLIEIARKSGQKLRYEIEEVDDEISLFHQQVSFLTDANGVDQAPDLIAETRRHYSLLRDNNILLQYKGDFSQKSILPLLNIVENNVGSTPEERIAAKKVGHVLIETLQNISKHGLEIDGKRDGLFVIGKDEDQVFIMAANFVDKSEVDDLQSHLDYLLSLSNEELKEIHREKIRHSIELEDKSRSGLGLIEIARASSEPMHYQLDEVDQNWNFFSLYVNV